MKNLPPNHLPQSHNLAKRALRQEVSHAYLVLQPRSFFFQNKSIPG